jgi:hypothetical protein
MRVVGEYLLMMAVSRAMQADDHHRVACPEKLGASSAIKTRPYRFAVPFVGPKLGVVSPLAPAHHALRHRTG